jgi:hypothetical protein
MENKIIEFIGTAKLDSFKGNIIWGVDKNEGCQRIADIRGWGAIQNLFVNKNGTINEKEAEDFQDALGQFIVDAINEKILKNK